MMNDGSRNTCPLMNHSRNRMLVIQFDVVGIVAQRGSWIEDNTYHRRHVGALDEVRQLALVR